MSSSDKRTAATTGAQSRPVYAVTILMATAVLLAVSLGALTAGSSVNRNETNSRFLRDVSVTTDAGIRGSDDSSTRIQYYYDDTATVVRIWPLPQDSSDWFAVRFDQDELEACTLTTARVLLYRPYMTGTPDLQIDVFEDDGFGLPGALWASKTIPYDSLPPDNFGWAEVDFAPQVFGPGEQFHIGMSTIGGEGDTLFVVSDLGTGPHAGEDRSEARYPGDGLWYTTTALYGLDYVFFVEADMACILYSSISGFKFEDINGNSVYEPGMGDGPLPGVDIFLHGVLDAGGTLDRMTTTDAQGEYWFPNIPAGDYWVSEDPGTYYQTFPTSVSYYIPNFQYNDFLSGYDFGNDTICVYASSFESCLDGTDDNFVGPEFSNLSPGLLTFLQSLGGYIDEFDHPAADQAFGHTFEDCWNEHCVVVGGSIRVKLRGSNGGCDNDFLILGDYSAGTNGAFWSVGTSDLKSLATGVPGSTFGVGDVVDITLDLANLPAHPWRPNNALAALQDGSFDIVVSDDTEVDLIEVSVELCCTPLIIQDVHDNAFTFNDGRTLVVEGDFTFNTEGQLVSSIDDYLSNQAMPAKSVLFLNGDTLTEDCFGGRVSLTGSIDSIGLNPHPYRPEEDTLLIFFDVQGYELLSEGDPRFAASVAQPVSEDIVRIPASAERGVCKFAVLLVGGIDPNNNQVREANVVKLYFEKLTLHMGYDPSDVYVLFYTGDPSPFTGVIPASSIYDATLTTLDNTVQTIINDMANCRNSGDKSSFFLMTYGEGEINGEINLLGTSTLPLLNLSLHFRALHNVGCEDVYLAMGQNYAGIPALHLKVETPYWINTTYPTKFRVTSSSHVNTKSISTATGDKYLEGLINEMATGDSFEKATIEACTDYYDDLKSILQPTQDEQNAIASGPIVWQRHRFQGANTYNTIVGFPGGKFEFRFFQEEVSTWTCANSRLWEFNSITNLWDYVLDWNYNIPGYELNWPTITTYEPGNELRTECIDPSSTGLYGLESLNDNEYTVTTSSHMYRIQSWKKGDNLDCSTSPSNDSLYAGFVVGWDDNSPLEFAEITSSSHSLSGPNDTGFSLGEMPRRLGSSGVTNLDATLGIPMYNVFWTDMQLILDVAEVTTPGSLAITLPDTAMSVVTLNINDTGVYTVPIGAIPDGSLHTITFDASGTDFAVDAWSVISLIGESCCIIRGDINHGGSGPDIADLVFLVSYMFSGGDPPPCMAEADINGDGTGPDISDLVYLVAYMFSGGPAPVPCP